MNIPAPRTFRRRCWQGAGLFLGATLAGLGASLLPYDPTPGAVPSTTYRLTVAGQPVLVEKFKDVSYARFALTGSADVVVTVTAPLGEFLLSPVRLMIPTRRQGAEIAFTLEGPRKLVLQCDGLEKLFIFADPPEVNPPQLGREGVISVLDFVRDSSGTTLQRREIQRGIDSVGARPGGGVLYFPRGTYLTGTLVVPSGVTLYLASGALLQGTADPRDYTVAASEPARAGPSKGTGALLYFVDARKSALAGRGTVAIEGTKIRQVVQDHPRLCNLVRCTDCEIRDVLFRDSGGFNLHMIRCENLRFSGYKIVNDLTLSNQDGTDPDSSRNILIEDVFMYTSDDAIAVKADVALCENVTVRHCVFWTKKSALKVGSDPYWGARHIVFEGNDVVHADRALALYAKYGFIEDVRFSHNSAEAVGGDLKQQLVVFEVSKASASGDRRGIPYTGYIRDVIVDGFLACRPSPHRSIVRGAGPGHAVTQVEFRDFYLGDRAVKSAADGELEIGPAAAGVTFSVSSMPPPERAALHCPSWVH